MNQITLSSFVEKMFEESLDNNDMNFCQKKLYGAVFRFQLNKDIDNIDSQEIKTLLCSVRMDKPKKYFPLWINIELWEPIQDTPELFDIYKRVQTLFRILFMYEEGTNCMYHSRYCYYDRTFIPSYTKKEIDIVVEELECIINNNAIYPFILEKLEYDYSCMLDLFDKLEKYNKNNSQHPLYITTQKWKYIYTDGHIDFQYKITDISDIDELSCSFMNEAESILL
jgi:hypothetical protein